MTTFTWKSESRWQVAVQRLKAHLPPQRMKSKINEPSLSCVSPLQSDTLWTTWYSSGTRREPCRWPMAWRYLSSYWKRRRTCATAPSTTTQVSVVSTLLKYLHLIKFICLLQIRNSLIFNKWIFIDHVPCFLIPSMVSIKNEYVGGLYVSWKEYCSFVQ